MLIIAHRGARSSHPENTLAAIQAAIDCGCEAIEIDVHEHHGEFWVIHDKWLNRTTNGIGMLKWYGVDKLSSLDAGQGEKLPTLRQVLELVAGQCALNIELKELAHLDVLEEHMQYAVQQCGFINQQILLSSFNHCWLEDIRSRDPDYLIGALTASQGVTLAEFAEDLEANAICIDLSVIDREYVLDAKSRGMPVYVYTANEPEDWEWLDEIGVDGVFCDCPDKAIAFYPQPEEFNWE